MLEARAKKEAKTNATIAAAAKGATVNPKTFNQIFFDEKQNGQYAIYGKPLSKPTYVTFKCKPIGIKKKIYVFTAFLKNDVQIGGVCRSADKIAELIGGGPAAAIKK